LWFTGLAAIPLFVTYPNQVVEKQLDGGWIK
jgi:hypothetical protein